MVKWQYLFLVFWFCSTACLAAQEPIRLGMSAPFSGPAAELGLSYHRGAELVFNKQNQQGGIAGRRIELITMDDGYEPVQTVANTRQLVFSHKVLALFGYIGTPTSNAVLPLLRHEQIPYLMPFSGADLLRQSDDHFIFNFRASYAEEAKAQISYLVDKLGLRKIALLIQADEFGATLEQNFLTELSYRGIKPVVISRFQRNSTDLTQAVQLLQQHQPELVLTVGTYHTLAKAISLAAQQNVRPVFSVVSFTGVSELASMLSNNDKVIASMVMPDHRHNPSKLAAAYRQVSGKNVPQNDIAFEGFAAATLVLQALKDCAADISRSCLLKALPKQQLYDFPTNYDVKRHQASQHVYLVELKNNRIQPLPIND